MNDNLQLQIERYISNSMSKEEFVLFEIQIKKDDALQKEVALAKELNHFLRNEPIDNKVQDKTYAKKIKEYLKSEEAVIIEKKLLKVKNEYHLKHNKNKSKKRFYYIAASIVAIFLFSLLAKNVLNQNSNKNLYAQYYTVNDLPSLIKRNDSKNELILGVLEFNKSKYNKALTYFVDYKSNTQNIDYSVYLYQGMTFLKLKQYKKAILEFDKMINSNAIDKSKGLWFKTLVYLKTNDLTNAKKTLQKIKKEDFNYKKAQELLKKIN